MSGLEQRRCPCGNSIEEERWLAGYHYCKKPSCFRRWGKHQTIHAVAVNKSMDAILSVESSTPEDERVPG
jgi:hypothetical protein